MSTKLSHKVIDANSHQGPAKWIDELVIEAAAIEAEEAQKAGTVGYMARLLAQENLVFPK